MDLNIQLLNFLKVAGLDLILENTSLYFLNLKRSIFDISTSTKYTIRKYKMFDKKKDFISLNSSIPTINPDKAYEIFIDEVSNNPSSNNIKLFITILNLWILIW